MGLVRQIGAGFVGGGFFLLLQGMAIAETLGTTFPALKQWSFNPQTQVLQIHTHNLAEAKYFVLREPARIVVDVRDTSWGAGTVIETYTGNVNQIRVAQFEEGVTRFVIDWQGQQAPQTDNLQLRSIPQGNGAVVWQLSLNTGQAIAPETTPTGTSPTPRISSDFPYPPALLPPPFRGSFTVAPPPNL